MVEEHEHGLKRMARHFWAPVPWMLEATIVLQIIIGKYIEALMIGALLIFNVALSVLQENRAEAALALLEQRLSLKARVKRDSRWVELPAAVLVPGDVVQLSVGVVVPGDVRIIEGSGMPEVPHLSTPHVFVEWAAGGCGSKGLTPAKVRSWSIRAVNP